MNFNYVVTRQYLLKSHTNYTITLLGKTKSKILAIIQYSRLSTRQKSENISGMVFLAKGQNILSLMT